MDAKESAALRSLLDRDEIGQVLVKFARALDEKDWEGYANLYAEDGVFRRPNNFHRGRAGMAAGGRVNTPEADTRGNAASGVFG